MKRYLFILLLFPLIVNAQFRFPYPTQTSGTPPSIYTDGYQAVLDEMTTDPTGDTLGWGNDLMRSMLDSGFLAITDYMLISKTTDNGAGEALIDWSKPSRSATNISATAWEKNMGFGPGDGIADYILANFHMIDSAVNYSQNSGAIGIWLNINEQATGDFVYGARAISADEAHLVARTTGDVAAGEMNGGSFTSQTTTNSDGFLMVSRTASNATDVYRNGASLLISPDTDASTGVPDAEMFILNRSGAAGYSTNQFAIFIIMGGMSSSQVSGLYSIFLTYVNHF